MSAGWGMLQVQPTCSAKYNLPYTLNASARSRPMRCATAAQVCNAQLQSLQSRLIRRCMCWPAMPCLAHLFYCLFEFWQLQQKDVCALSAKT
jgi:hypothetical protein